MYDIRCCYLTSGSEQGVVAIRQMDSNEILHTFRIEVGPVRSMSVATNGKITVAHGDR